MILSITMLMSVSWDVGMWNVVGMSGCWDVWNVGMWNVVGISGCWDVGMWNVVGMLGYWDVWRYVWCRGLDSCFCVCQLVVNQCVWVCFEKLARFLPLMRLTNNYKNLLS